MARPTIHLVNPKSNCLTSKPQYFGKALYSPLAGLLALSAITPEDEWEMFLTDENVESIDFSRHCDLVAISAMTEYVNRGYEIADQYLSSQKAHRLLGWHARYSLDDGLRETMAWYADFLGIGED